MDVHVFYTITTALPLRSMDCAHGAGEWFEGIGGRCVAASRNNAWSNHCLLGMMTCSEKAHSVKSARRFQRDYLRPPTRRFDGQCVIDLELVAKASDSDKWIN